MAFDPDFGRVVPRDVKLRVLGGWGLRQVGKPGEHKHQGLDIPLRVGTPIYAAASGTVAHVSPTSTSDAGIYVAITHPSQLTSRYLHLSRASVERGQRVEKGDQIGLSGNTGLSEGPHLHFDLFAASALLPTVIATVGEPKGGFGTRASFGVAIPPEPWLPVDDYATHVINAASASGVPLFHERPREPSRKGPLIAVAVGLGVAALALITWSASSGD